MRNQLSVSVRFGLSSVRDLFGVRGLRSFFGSVSIRFGICSVRCLFGEDASPLRFSVLRCSLVSSLALRYLVLRYLLLKNPNMKKVSAKISEQEKSSSEKFWVWKTADHKKYLSTSSAGAGSADTPASAKRRRCYSDSQRAGWQIGLILLIEYSQQFSGWQTRPDLLIEYSQNYLLQTHRNYITICQMSTHIGAFYFLNKARFTNSLPRRIVDILPHRISRVLWFRIV